MKFLMETDVNNSYTNSLRELQDVHNKLQHENLSASCRSEIELTLVLRFHHPDSDLSEAINAIKSMNLIKSLCIKPDLYDRRRYLQTMSPYALEVLPLSMPISDSAMEIIADCFRDNEHLTSCIFENIRIFSPVDTTQIGENQQPLLIDALTNNRTLRTFGFCHGGNDEEFLAALVAANTGLQKIIFTSDGNDRFDPRFYKLVQLFERNTNITNFTYNGGFLRRAMFYSEYSKIQEYTERNKIIGEYCGHLRESKCQDEKDPSYSKLYNGIIDKFINALGSIPPNFSGINKEEFEIIGKIHKAVVEKKFGWRRGGKPACSKEAQRYLSYIDEHLSIWEKRLVHETILMGCSSYEYVYIGENESGTHELFRLAICKDVARLIAAANVTPEPSPSPTTPSIVRAEGERQRN